MAKNRITDKGRKRQRRGYGAGTDNRPWLTVRDFSSSGKSFRVLGDVTNRVHQLLSTLEYKVFSSFDWNPLVTDIREQCSLPLEETTSIALELGIRHPTHKGKPVVMSTDFYVILKNRSVAITVKYSRKLTKRAIHNEDLFEFTRRVTKALFEQNPPSKKDIIEKSLKCGLLTHVGKRVEVQFKKFSELIQNLFQAFNIHPGTNFRRIKAALSVANKFCDPLTLIAIELICERIQKTTVLEPDCPKVPCVNKLCPHYKTIAKITSEFHELNHCKTEGLIQRRVS